MAHGGNQQSLEAVGIDRSSAPAAQTNAMQEQIRKVVEKAKKDKALNSENLMLVKMGSGTSPGMLTGVGVGEKAKDEIVIPNAFCQICATTVPERKCSPSTRKDFESPPVR